MTLPARVLTVGMAAAGLALGGAVGAMASPVGLTDGQLDGVTAGAAVTSSVDAAAIGALSLTQTTSNSFVARDPNPIQPGLGASGGAADGVAVAVGTNVGGPGAGPTGATTNVQTAGAASGNQVIISNYNYTVQGAGGVQFQAGWTFAYGAWTGL